VQITPESLLTVSILWYRWVQYRVQKSPPLILHMSKLNPINRIQRHLRSILIESSVSTNSKYSLSFIYSDQNLCAFLFYFSHPISASCRMGTASFPGVKSGRGVTLTPHPLLVSWSRKSRAIPLLALGDVRPVQSLSACTRVHFTFYLYLSQPRAICVFLKYFRKT